MRWGGVRWGRETVYCFARVFSQYKSYVNIKIKTPSQTFALGNFDWFSIPSSPAPFPCRIQVVEVEVVDHTHNRNLVHRKANGDGRERETVDKIGRAIDGIHHPRRIIRQPLTLL